LCAGALAAIAGSPTPPLAADAVSAPQLAEWIRAGRAGLQVLDTRDGDAIAHDRLPGARRAADTEPDAVRGIDTIVVYADSHVDEAVVEVLRRRWSPRRVLRLHGGIDAWNQEVLFPTLRADASARQQQEFESRAQLSRYFGGAPRVLEPGASSDRSRSRRGC
jgi:rhodanese-related sulfurtransferase